MDTPGSALSQAGRATTRLNNAISFKVELSCTKSHQTLHRVIAFPEEAPPSTVADIKEKVEEEFSIPICVQDLRYETYGLSDGTLLETARIRSGDSFLITYSAEGDCQEIKRVVRWFALVRKYLIAEDPILRTNPMSYDFEDLITLGINEELIENLAFKYLFPWLDARKYANKLHFVQYGGLDVVMDVYAALHHHPWKECVLKLKYVEYGILRVLWNLSETFELRRLIMWHNDGLVLCIKSLLRQKLEEGKAIEDETDAESHRANSWVLVENIGAALGLLCNLSELPECHIKIAYNEECLDQLTCISLTPTVRIMSVQLVATLFLCVAYTPLTHPFLAKPLLIRRLLDACAKDRIFRNEDEEDDKVQDMLMLRYFTQVFLAQVILASPQHVPEEFQQRIHDFMEDFLNTATYQALMEGEVKHWYVWSTFLPYIRLVYLPETTQAPSSELVQQLHMLGLQTILLSLQNMLGRDNHREVLFKEGLEDYITCIPAYVPGSLRGQAEELVRVVGSGVQLQPPRLVNLVKAKLAKVHFGLQHVVHMTVGELINEALPTCS